MKSIPVKICGGHGELSVVGIPSSYGRVAGLAWQRNAPRCAVAQLLDDVESGTSTRPIGHAVRRRA
jgi:hypothetical protein